MTDHPPGPTTPARPYANAWREHLHAKLDRLVFEAELLVPSPQRHLALHYLGLAQGAVDPASSSWRSRLARSWSGSDVERAWVSTHAAQVAMLRASSPERVAAELPTIIAKCTPLFPAGDDRIRALQNIAASPATVVTGAEHDLAGDVVEDAYAISDEQHVRVRSFRNILIATAVAMALLALLVGVLACIAPGAFAVCDSVTAPQAVSSCPTGGSGPSGGDVFLVEVLGLAGAAITAAAAIRKLQGTSTPYAVPLVSLLLKLPTGAITALFGIMLLRAGFGPAITTLTQAEVVAYALLFGSAQQLFLQFVDKRAKNVLDAVATAT